MFNEVFYRAPYTRKSGIPCINGYTLLHLGQKKPILLRSKSPLHMGQINMSTSFFSIRNKNSFSLINM